MDYLLSVPAYILSYEQHYHIRQAMAINLTMTRIVIFFGNIYHQENTSNMYVGIHNIPHAPGRLHSGQKRQKNLQVLRLCRKK
jgi:hypothetical protein